MILLKIGIVLIASILSSITYHAGGLGRDYSPSLWYSRWNRRISCPILTILCTLMFLDRDSLQGFEASTLVVVGISVLSAVLLAGSLCTYWKKLFGDKYFWVNFTATGAISGLASIPFAFVIPWYLILARAVALAVFVGVWTRLVQSPKWSELGRGWFLVFSLLIFLF